MSKITIDIMSDTKTQTLEYEADGFDLLPGEIKSAKPLGNGSYVSVPKAWEGDLVLCIRLTRGKK